MTRTKKAAIAAGIALALGTAGTAVATTINIGPTINPTVSPEVSVAEITDSFNIMDSFLLNSHNNGDSEFIDFSNGLNVLYNTVSIDTVGTLGAALVNNLLANALVLL
jgi:hypothetical protein